MTSPWLPSCLGCFLLLSLVASVRYDAVTQQTGYFWQIDSANLNLNFSVVGDKTRNCQAHSSPHTPATPHYLRPVSEFGDPECDSPIDLVRSATDFIKKVRGEDFDFILWTGDSSPNIMAEDENVTRHLTEMTLLLREQFPYSSIYPVLGDRDIQPGRQDTSMYDIAANLWGTWLPPKAVASLKKSGYYKIDLAGRKLQLLALHTSLYVETRTVTHTTHSQDRQLQWLAQCLQKAESEHKSVILFGHSPPGVFEGDWYSPGRHWIQIHTNNRLRKLILRFQKTIVGQFYGHQNTDSFRIFYDSDNRHPANGALIAPGLSPRSLVEGMRNPIVSSPSIRLYKYSVYDGKVLDYTQFSLSLSRSAKEARPVWELQYNFSSMYGVDAITTDSLHRVYSDMIRENSQTLVRYLKANRHGSTPPCPASCSRVHLCAIPNVDINNFNKCVSLASGQQQESGPYCGLLLLLLLHLLSY